ncbi:IPT/TIG domain-containing protein [Entamoeba marina]
MSNQFDPRTSECYPQSRPAPLTHPKRDFTKTLLKMRGEFRVNERIRKDRMRGVLDTINKTCKPPERSEKISGSIANLLKGKTCELCGKTLLVSTPCMCCGAVFCGSCKHAAVYSTTTVQKTVVDNKTVTNHVPLEIELELCKYCHFVFVAITEAKVFENNLVEGQEHLIVPFHHKITQTCIAFIESYRVLQLYQSLYMQSVNPAETFVRECMDNVVEVRGYIKKVGALKYYIDEYDVFERSSDIRVATNIKVALAVFNRTAVLSSISDVEVFEKVIKARFAGMIAKMEPIILGVNSGNVPCKGGVAVVNGLYFKQGMRVLVNGKKAAYKLVNDALEIMIQPMTDPEHRQIIIHIASPTGKNVPFPGTLMYKDVIEKNTEEDLLDVDKLSISCNVEQVEEKDIKELDEKTGDKIDENNKDNNTTKTSDTTKEVEQQKKCKFELVEISDDEDYDSEDSSDDSSEVESSEVESNESSESQNKDDKEEQLFVFEKEKSGQNTTETETTKPNENIEEPKQQPKEDAVPEPKQLPKLPKEDVAPEPKQLPKPPKKDVAPEFKQLPKLPKEDVAPEPQIEEENQSKTPPLKRDSTQIHKRSQTDMPTSTRRRDEKRQRHRAMMLKKTSPIGGLGDDL